MTLWNVMKIRDPNLSVLTVSLDCFHIVPSWCYEKSYLCTRDLWVSERRTKSCSLDYFRALVILKNILNKEMSLIFLCMLIEI